MNVYPDNWIVSLPVPARGKAVNQMIRDGRAARDANKLQGACPWSKESPGRRCAWLAGWYDRDNEIRNGG